MRQVLFNKMTLPIQPDAMEKRLARKQEREKRLDEIAAKIGPLDDLREDPNDKYKQID